MMLALLTDISILVEQKRLPYRFGIFGSMY